MVTRDLNKINNEVRLKILEVLSTKDMHLAEISKELNISNACVSKNVRILEDANLVKRTVFGRSHIISLTNKTDKDINAEKELTDLELYIIEGRFIS
ncbi:winged helix-turn-helix domain-containing protein [Methanolobus vulcani]|uniref:Winged helix-turn-helix transcriptional regulator n=1 Tax=Methanolobus vulcani TaxID=38026 RepID=A0A7Z8KM89_9EURY|nr:winged helix-turn-helix domain-containing protein [Methanolobus vulcani]TQD24425.1 winged helix-turn-helix transcriptional regulator [Methanolobus vulcani]